MEVICEVDEELLKRGSFQLTPPLRSLLRNYCRGLEVALHLPDGRKAKARFHKLNSTFSSRQLATWLRHHKVKPGQRVRLETVGPDIENAFRVPLCSCQKTSSSSS